MIYYDWDKLRYENKNEKRNIKKMIYKIYKLVYNNEVIYIGCTKQKYLSSRKSGKYKHIPIEIKKESSIELIEETDDISRECYWVCYYIELGYNLYNKYKGNTGLIRKDYFKIYRDDNREKVLYHKKKYRDNNKEKLKEYIEKNKEYISEQQKRYKIENTDKIKEYKIEYYENNKEKIKEYKREYYKKNKSIL